MKRVVWYCPEHGFEAIRDVPDERPVPEICFACGVPLRFNQIESGDPTAKGKGVDLFS